MAKRRKFTLEDIPISEFKASESKPEGSLYTAISEYARFLVRTKGYDTAGEADFSASETERVYEMQFEGKPLRVVRGIGLSNGNRNDRLTIEYGGKQVYSDLNGEVSEFVSGVWRKAFAW